MPLAVLVTVVGATVIARLGRAPLPEGPRAAVSMTSASTPGAPPSGLLAPLRAPRDASGSARPDASETRLATAPDAVDASTPTGAPRMVHGGPRHLHRSAARGPRTVTPGWRTNVGGPVAAQVTASPDERTLYVATLAGSVVALARSDGAKQWSAALGDRVYSTPLVHEDGTVYVGSDAKKLVALSPQGAVLWRLEVDGEADSGGVFAKDGTIVFAAGSSVHAVRRGGDLAWRFTAKGKVYTAPALTEEGLVIVGSQDHHVHALTAGGTLSWSTDLGADVDGAAAIGDDGAIYVGTDRGEVVRLDGRGRIAWRVGEGGMYAGSCPWRETEMCSRAPTGRSRASFG